MDGIKAANAEDRSKNPLRPQSFDEIVGQEKAIKLMRRAVASCFERRKPLDHVLLVAASGTGKTTFSHVVANELGVRVYKVEAPVSTEQLHELRGLMWDGDLLMIEEIHQQAIMERRGRTGNTQPEVLYAVMEDRVLDSPTGPLEFAKITVIGTTTDEGLLPDAFINRFPLRPRLVPYTLEQLRTIVRSNAETLEVVLSEDAVGVFAGACRGVPREINNLVKNAQTLFGIGHRLNADDAREVLDINGVTEDGLTADMQSMLTYMLSQGRVSNGELRYTASVSSIATNIGKSRDSKAVVLRVEPYLIQRGFVQIAPGLGRILTDSGIARASELVA